MINKAFIEHWGRRYDVNVSERDVKLYKKIKGKIKNMFSGYTTKYVTRDILYDIMDWKAPRVRRRIKSNRLEFVQEATKHCFASSDEQFKIEGLTVIGGIKYRAATAILHFCFPSKYIVMDFRAWWTLQDQKEMPGDYKIEDDFEHWQKYLSVCREISKRCGCSLRKLDKALWQYSEEDKGEIR